MISGRGRDELTAEAIVNTNSSRENWRVLIMKSWRVKILQKILLML
jgi:hypothetical protein